MSIQRISQFNKGTQSVSTTAVQVVAGNPKRVSLIISVPSSATVSVFFLPDNTTTTGTGIEVEPGGTLVDGGEDVLTRAWFAIVASGSVVVRYVEATIGVVPVA